MDNEKFLDAASKGQIEIIKSLIKAGIDINIKNNNRWNALLYAARYGYTEIAKLLIESGIDINAKDKYRRTALIRAVCYGYIEIVKLLIKSGIDINEKDNVGRTALIFAACYGHIEIAELLLEHDVDINAEDNNEWSAPMHAAYNGHKEIELLLIKKKLSISNDKIKKLENINQNMTNHLNFAPDYSSGYLKTYKDFETQRNNPTIDIKSVDPKDLEDYSITIEYKKDKNNSLYIETSDGFECVGSIDNHINALFDF